MMRSFCNGEILDKPPAGVAVMVGTEVLEGVTCTVDVASVVAAGDWQAERMTIAIIITEKIKVFFDMSPFQLGVTRMGSSPLDTLSRESKSGYD